MTTRTLAPALRAAALAACACLVALPALAAPKSTIVLGATNSTSSHFAVANGMVKAIKAGIPSSNVSVIETGASVDNVRRLTKSEIDIGLIATDTGIQALTGTGPFQGRAVDDLVAVYSYDVSVLNVAVTQDSGIADLKGLAGKKFNPGIRGSGAELLTRQVFGTLGIEPQWVPGTVKDATEGIQNRQIVGYSKYGPGQGVDATLRELMVTTPMRLLSFDADAQAKVTSTVKGVGFTQIANVMQGQGAVTAPTVLIVYGTRRSLMDDETAFAIAKAIHEHKQSLIEAWPHLRDFDFKAQALAAEKVGIPLHPGAKKYWTSVQ
ncbi:MAG: TAXI family TRAP transporter solute-binding subunit [Burkholderiales bacterium]|nr:TAXI family TRAP transporter solute-binding subunit [Burkholderiales bacterium]GIK86902.1 MAG: TRAP ABC transporter [Betaproteobacteria bacterium]